ncbi:MAG: hypothetical protein JNK72_02080 [Myxococcales bacterium]|nr:hypothetical protein [Myxococcales bacterium]
MAFFSAKPSRGSWFFFGAVVLGVLGVRGYHRNENHVARRDAPASEAAVRLASCVTGPNVDWLLTDPASPGAAARWGAAISEWARAAMVSSTQNRWPARCAVHATELAQRLDRVPDAGALADQARQFANELEASETGPLRFIARVDAGHVGTALGQLMAGTYNLSTGSREGWRLGERAAIPEAPEAPRFLPFDPTEARLTLASATRFVTWSNVRGGAMRFDVREGALQGAALGAVIPWGDPPAGAALWAETESGSAAVTVGDDPRAYALPRDFEPQALRAERAWESARSTTHLGVLLRDGGTLRFRATPLDGPVNWSREVQVGDAESWVAATLVADGPGRWRVTGLRPRLESAEPMQYQIVAEGSGWRVAGPEAVQFDRPTGEPEDGDPAPESALRGARYFTCAAGDIRYIAAVSERNVSVLQVQATRLKRSTVSALWPEFRSVAVSCDAERVLLAPGNAEAISTPGAWQMFHFSPSTHSGGPVALPEMPSSTQVQAMRLTAEGLIAVISTEGALRVLRYEQGERWSAGPLLLSLSPSPTRRRVLREVQLVSEGEAALVRVIGHEQDRLPVDPNAQGSSDEPPPVRWGPARAFTLVMASDDAGRSFVTLSAAPSRRPLTRGAGRLGSVLRPS